jgi:lysophospholipase L1-like esterase
VQFSKSYNGYPNTSRFQDFKIYYGNAKRNTPISIFSAGNIWKDTLHEGNFQVEKLPIDSFKKDIKIEFPADLGADVYAVSMDCKKGVAVDNVAMRGSSGTDFTRIDGAYLAQQMQALNTKLLILQFGVNVAPHVLNDYSFYEKAYYRQLKYLKDNLPGVSILVIGISDMSTKDGGHYVSYPNITLIRDAQKKAAFKAGCAFWDLYEAMGGENSMPSWVNSKPSLAEKDFTHFNANGAKIIGEMIYNALMSEYLAYKNPDVAAQ